MKIYSRVAVASEVRALLVAADSIGATRNVIVPLDVLRAVLRELTAGDGPPTFSDSPIVIAARAGE